MNISQGGTWKPPKCTPRHKSVLLVPYRDRPEHLEKFLLLLHPFLQAQKLNYAVVVVEQEGGAQFNRAKLFNVGFSEAVAAGMVGLGTCLIFHDVDLVRTNFPRDLFEFRGLGGEVSTTYSSHVTVLQWDQEAGGGLQP